MDPWLTHLGAQDIMLEKPYFYPNDVVDVFMSMLSADGDLSRRSSSDVIVRVECPGGKKNRSTLILYKYVNTSKY